MNPENIAVMIPLVAIILGLAIPIVGMSLEYRMKKDLFELHHKERMAGIEKACCAMASFWYWAESV
jgi:hypothetical protein